MSEKQSPNNVIQFPGKKKKDETSATPAVVLPATKKTGVAGIIAVMLFSIAVNQYAFNPVLNVDLASTQKRGLASVGARVTDRDAEWERQLAERLASTHTRGVASTHIGRPASKEERLRWGILEEKYTITYKPERQSIRQIFLQGAQTDPSYILDRNGFLAEYGSLFDAGFEMAKLKSVEKSEDKTIESYTLYGKDNQPKGEARFELDRYKRLLSLKVEPVQI